MPGQTQEYLRKKRLKEMNLLKETNLPKLYWVHSTPEGVEEPQEVEVIEIRKGVVNCIRYPKGDDYESREEFFKDVYVTVGHGNVCIEQEKGSEIDSGYGSGFGDLWSWTNYYTLSLDDAKSHYEKESERIREKYVEPKLKEKYRILTKFDLIKGKRDADINDIGIYDFKNTSITLDEIHQAYFIIYVDEDKRKVLKDRFI